MAKRAPKQTSAKSVEALKHDEAKRKNIPTAEYQSVIQKEEEKPRTIKYPVFVYRVNRLRWLK
jgi:adenine-specific DNA-methyltransferase